MDFRANPSLVSEIIMTQRPVYPYLQMLRQHFGSGKIMSDFLDYQKIQQKHLQEAVDKDRAEVERQLTEIHCGWDGWGHDDPPVIQIFDIAFGGIEEMTVEYNSELYWRAVEFERLNGQH